MSSGSTAPTAPNYQPVADASRAASELQYKTSREQLDWAKEQYADNKAYTDEAKTKLMTALDESTANARKDRARYEDLYQPIEDQAIEKAKTYGTPEYEELQRGRATAAVAQQFDAAGESAKRSLESYGIDPSATRYQALDVGVRSAKAAATAAAANQSDVATRAAADNAQTAVINTGKGYPAQAINSANSGTNAINSGVGAQNSTYSAAAPALGNPTAWSGLGNQSIGTWGSTLTNMYGAQMAGYNASQNSSSGIGSAVGGLAGLAGAFMMSDERLKENITHAGKTNDGQNLYKFNFKGSPKTQIGLLADEVQKHHPDAVAEGESGFKMVNYDKAIPDGRTGRRIVHAASGGAIPAEASPSGGAQVDDVPARVQVGEFITPEDVVSWYGEKFFQKQIEKARAERSGTMAEGGAKPQMKPAIPTQPTYMSPGAAQNRAPSGQGIPA